MSSSYGRGRYFDDADRMEDDEPGGRRVGLRVGLGLSGETVDSESLLSFVAVAGRVVRTEEVRK